MLQCEVLENSLAAVRAAATARPHLTIDDSTVYRGNGYDGVQVAGSIGDEDDDALDFSEIECRGQGAVGR